jgi:type II secretory pathway component GspD/PulD (secretin)
LITTFVPNLKSGSIAATIVALQQQGEVHAVSQPRLRALNNQTAIIKVGTEQPFFSSSSGFIPGSLGGQSGTFTNSTFQMITVGTVLSITPQISREGQITLDVSPVITSLAGVESSGGDETGSKVTAPILDIKQSSSLIRVKNGETVIIGGLIQDKVNNTKRQIPVLGDIPLVGRIFRGTFKAKQRVELVIFLTPTIVD